MLAKIDFLNGSFKNVALSNEKKTEKNNFKRKTSKLQTEGEECR